MNTQQNSIEIFKDELTRHQLQFRVIEKLASYSLTKEDIDGAINHLGQLKELLPSKKDVINSVEAAVMK